MSVADDIPQADQLDGAPHPREAARVFGQSQAEVQFLDAVRQDRLHHAWLVTGPRGVGKATLAWRIARFLLATPIEQADGLFGAPAEPPDLPETLDIPSNHPIARRVLALSEPNLFLLRRPWDEKTKRLKQDITVDAARKLKGFFAMSAGGGARRVVIVDAADELNPSAANAVLKLLEEPPEHAVLLLVCHRPSRILPTIRSRCRTLRCAPLGPEDLSRAVEAAGIEAPDDTILTLADGSAGAAISLAAQDGAGLYQHLLQIMNTLPRLDRGLAGKLAETASGRAGESHFRLTIDMIDTLLSRMARHGATGIAQQEAATGEAALFVRLCPDAATARGWAELQSEISANARAGAAVNLDPSALLLDMFLQIETRAQALSVASTPS